MDKIIIANWKEYPASVAEAIILAKATDYESVVMCPPAEFLEAVGGVLQKAKLGTQDVFWNTSPAGVVYTLIGHSDQRVQGDTDDSIADKLARAVRAGVIPILCVGETRDQKDRGEKEQTLASQIKIPFQKCITLHIPLQTVYIAYEPLWTISTEFGAEPEKPTDVVASITFIKEQLLHGDFGMVYGKGHMSHIRYLYGGSVTSANVAFFLQQPDIDGVLVGGASRDPEELTQIWHIVQTETAQKS